MKNFITSMMLSLSVGLFGVHAVSATNNDVAMLEEYVANARTLGYSDKQIVAQFEHMITEIDNENGLTSFSLKYDPDRVKHVLVAGGVVLLIGGISGAGYVAYKHYNAPVKPADTSSNTQNNGTERTGEQEDSVNTETTLREIPVDLTCRQGGDLDQDGNDEEFIQTPHQEKPKAQRRVIEESSSEEEVDLREAVSVSPAAAQVPASEPATMPLPSVVVRNPETSVTQTLFRAPEAPALQPAVLLRTAAKANKPVAKKTNPPADKTVAANKPEQPKRGVVTRSQNKK